MAFLLIFSIFCVLSLKNVFDLKNSVEYLLRFLASLATFFILCDTINRPNQVINILKLLVFSSLFVCVYGLWEFFITNAELPLIINGRLNNFRRILSTFNQPNATAAYLVVVIPLVIFFVRNSINLFTDIMYILILFLNLICLALTFSRAGFFCFLLSLFFLFKKKYVIILSFVIVLFFFLSGLFNFIGRSASIERRYQRYKDGIQFVFNKPFFGHGFRDYKNLYLEYELPEDLQQKSAHSLYLNILVETGLIGFFSFAAFILLVLKKVTVPIRKLEMGITKTFYIRNLSMSILGSFVALFSMKLFETSLTSLLMWTMLAVYQKWPFVWNSGK
jgi:putative inorganic carbon (hco3(-)) transporter